MLTVFLTLCGLYALATGKAPAVIAGSREVQGDRSKSRLVGLILALAFPLSMLLARGLPLLLGPSALMFGPAVEIGIALLVLAAAFVTGRMSAATRRV
jgi:hypothetical protein